MYAINLLNLCYWQRRICARPQRLSRLTSLVSSSQSELSEIFIVKFSDVKRGQNLEAEARSMNLRPIAKVEAEGKKIIIKKVPNND